MLERRTTAVANCDVFNPKILWIAKINQLKTEIGTKQQRHQDRKSLKNK